MLCDQLGGGSAGDKSGGDDNVDILGLLEKKVVLRLLKLILHLLGIAALAAAVLNNALHGNVLPAERLNLLARLGAHIEAAHNGTHVLGRANGGEPGNTSTDDEDLGRRDLPRSGDLGRGE